ncbi:RNA polymerase, sigma 32 subunit, RpoH [Syntrophus gentianae]|uniref:RNA polymerase sigma factor n=1 Tax=Syntrophus gentianae TaxID=43775 RepID=A0A1H7YHZ7_9BACT|nr:RNA polymerase sigma factor RpoH [Syntrophus gentianae]SEM45862.1 RNA polymerase, sigma 32 subunit, RpoH [Syntrophus gentianae]
MKLPAIAGTLEVYMAEINRFPVLSVEEEFRYAIDWQKNGNMESAEKLVVSNLRFVVKIAHEYRNYGVKLADLIQEGNIGLMHAIKKFDPYKGYRLISYAVWWIRAYIQNYIIKTWSLVKIGTTQAQRKLFFKLNQTKKDIQALSLKNPEFREIADSLGVREDEVEEMDVRMSNRDLSLDMAISEDGGTSHMDYLTYTGEDQETALIRKQETEMVQKNISGALSVLNEKEMYIILHRVMADDPKTLQEIGDFYHITRERARQIEKQALKKLRLALPYLGEEQKLLGTGN